MNNNVKNNKGARFLFLLLIVLLAIFYRNVVVNEEEAYDPATLSASTEKIEATIAELDSINFDLSILNDPKFSTLLSIEKPLPNIPIGRVNPFAAVLGR